MLQWLFGGSPTLCERGIHDFRPRYDDEPVAGATSMEFSPDEGLRYPAKRTYRCDVCVRCGKVVTAP